MTNSMALSGKTDKDSAIDLHSFAKAFIASLVARDHLAVRPHSPADRRGFARVVRLLDERVADLAARKADPRLVRQVARVANELRPSNNGAFEGFEAALRSMQLTLASSPNPFYEEITFSVPKRYAEATVNSLPELQRTLVTEAADLFVKETGG